MCHEAAASGDDASHWKPALGIVRQRGIAHLLFHLKTERFFLRVAWDRFVDIGRHKE